VPRESVRLEVLLNPCCQSRIAAGGDRETRPENFP
jgi:hypothetical protein